METGQCSEPECPHLLGILGSKMEFDLWGSLPCLYCSYSLLKLVAFPIWLQLEVSAMSLCAEELIRRSRAETGNVPVFLFFGEKSKEQGGTVSDCWFASTFLILTLFCVPGIFLNACSSKTYLLSSQTIELWRGQVRGNLQLKKNKTKQTRCRWLMKRAVRI